MNYHNITHDDMNNGDGLRVVLWLSGCNHRCKGCQNPQTWDYNSGVLFNENAKTELFEQLDKDYISGITFSGGDPLHENNIKEVEKLIDYIKQRYKNKTIWLYSGYKYEQLDINRKRIVNKCDVFVDGRYVEELRDVNAHWVGSTNQRVIYVQKIKKGVIKHESNAK